MSTLQPRRSGVTNGTRREEARPWLIFVAVGAAMILAGGFVAAVGGEAPSKHLSWVAAYLVLVCGAAQVALGGGRALILPRQLRSTRITWQFITFNLANAAVLVGTVCAVVPVLYAGCLLLLVALALFAWDVRRIQPRPNIVVLYWALVLALAVSVPIGAVLGH